MLSLCYSFCPSVFAFSTFSGIIRQSLTNHKILICSDDGQKNEIKRKILPLQKGDPQTIKSWYMQLISVLNQKNSKSTNPNC